MQRSARTVDPTGICYRHGFQCVLVANSAGGIGIAGHEVGIFGQHAQGDARIGAIDAAADVAGIDQRQPAQPACSKIAARAGLGFDLGAQIREGSKATEARDTGLRIVQP